MFHFATAVLAKPTFTVVLLGTATALTLTGCGADAPLGPVANARTAAEIRGRLLEDVETETGVAEPTGTGWATIRGRFVYDPGREPPTMPPYHVTTEQHICAPGGRAPDQETLLVDSGTGGIKNIAVYLRDARRVHESAEPATDPVEFDQKECVFLSHVLAVTVGQPIEILNSDPTGHNTNIRGARNTFNQTIPAGGSITYVAQREEMVPAPVVCSIHPWMSAYLLPRANGYFAVTADDGSFEIANVPAGEPLEFQVWHESATGPGQALVVTTPEARALGWSNRGRFSVTLEPDEVKEFEVVVPASAFRL